MPVERGHSRRYLAAVLGRPPTAVEIWRHFHAFARALMLKLRVGEGQPHPCAIAAACGDFEELLVSAKPVLLGTFHVGNSDLVGFTLGRYRRKISIIRIRVGNSRDTRELARQTGNGVAFIWVNERENLIFTLKEAIQSGDTIAMECDRVGYSARLEAFEFLGARRLFPFSIYHLALIFRRPVVICVAVPDGPAASMVTSSPVFEPDDAPRADNLARARVHFQDFLMVIESILRQDPSLWFNFVPLNPEAPSRGAAR